MKMKNILLVVVLFSQNNILFAEGVWDILSSVRQTIDDYPGCSCDEPRTKIYDPGSGNTHTIDTPGNYIVVEDFVNGQIIITADDVDLDLNGREIAADVGLNDRIILLSGARKNIFIYNGYVTEASVDQHGYGIQVQDGSYAIQLENLMVSGSQYGVYLRGINGNDVVGCKIVDCDFVDNNIGIYFYYTNNTFVSNCRNVGFSLYGVSLVSSNYNYFNDCCVGNSIYNARQTCFYISDSTYNSFVKCFVKNVECTLGSNGYTRAFYFFSSSYDNNVIDCIISDLSSASGPIYGVYIATGVDDCIFESNIFANCGEAIRSYDADAFSWWNGNLAIKNLSFNNSESLADYVNVPNVNDYNVLGADDIGHMENSYVVWT